MRYLVAIAALAFAGAAQAQSSTTCTRIGNVTNCQHQPGSVAPYDYGAALRAAQDSHLDQQIRREQLRELRLRNEAAQRARVYEQYRSPDTPGVSGR